MFLVIGSNVFAETIEDFNDGSLNTTLWATQNTASTTESGGYIAISGNSGGSPSNYGCIYAKPNTALNTTPMGKTIRFNMTNSGTSNYAMSYFSVQPTDCNKQTTNYRTFGISWREQSLNPDITLHTNNGVSDVETTLYEGATFGTFYVFDLTLQENGTVRAIIYDSNMSVLGNVTSSQTFTNITMAFTIADWGGNAETNRVGNIETNPTPSTSTPNFSVTLKNSWNSGSINTFNITIWNGSVTYYFNTSNGTLETNISSNSSSLWNISYYSNGFFNNSYFDVNVSSNHQGLLNQSIINISARNIIDNSTYSNFSVIFNGTTFCNTTTTNCINFPLEGSYWAYLLPNDVSGFHPSNTSVTITALDNKTITIYAHEHYINVTARDYDTNATINTFNVTINSYNRTDIRSNYTTTGNATLGVIHDTYLLSIDAEGYALYNNEVNISITNDTQYTFYLFKENGVSITIYNESNGEILNNTNVTIYTYIDTVLIYTNITSTGNITFYNLTPENYTFRFEAENFAVKEYYVEVGNRSFQYLDAYMLQTAYSTIFTFIDSINANALEGVTLIIQRYINGSLEVVSSLTSDITGRVSFSYETNTPYYFTASLTNYTVKQFTLNPILFSSYTVQLVQTSTVTYTSDYSGVTIVYTPSYFINNQENTLSFTFASPVGKLSSYGFNVTYNGTTQSATDNNAYGSIISTTINITNAEINDVANVIYYYTTSDGATNSYAFNLEITDFSSGAYTIFSNKGETYGLGDLERALIVEVIIIIIVGTGSLFISGFVGALLGLFVLGFFAYMGFVTWWVTYPTMLFLFIYIVWGASK